jgi:parallel beta-helix repeat protein
MGIEVHAADNFIGGSSAATRNVISGNGSAGIYVSDDATGTTIVGNFVGTDATGGFAVGNAGTGVRVIGTGSFVGSDQAAQGNVVSGNAVGISIEGNGNSVRGNLVGVDATATKPLANGTGISVKGSGNTIGTVGSGANLVSGNTNTGIVVTSLGTGNAITGNLVGTNLLGKAPIGSSGAGIWVGGTQNTASQNLVSGNKRGFYLSGSGNVIQSNRVGTTINGDAALPNTAEGIFVAEGDHLIGGPNLGNVVAGNALSGIFVYGSKTAGTKIQGNSIGVGSGGQAIGNFQAGVALNDAFGVEVGGPNPGEGNVIAKNGWVGIDVFGGDGNSLLANSIYGNASAGIELQPPLGPMVNDPGDADFGSNGLQNYPVLSAALPLANGLHVTGTLSSAPLDAYRVELFANPACDPSGMGEGKVFLGAIDVVTDAVGNAAVVGDVAATNLGYVSATATSSGGDTSEFSPCLAVGGPNPGKFQFGLNPFLAYEELGQVVISVTRSEGSTGASSVHYETVNDTATAPSDFTATSGTLSFADGEVVKTFSVPLQLDASGEGTETFKVQLSQPTGGAGLGAQSVADVMLFDYQQSFPGTFVTGGAITEGDSGTKDLAFTVTVTPTNVPVDVKLHTVDGSAKAGSDYDAKTFQLTFQPGDAPKTIFVPIHGDTAIEGNEVFYVEVTSVSLGYVGDHGEGVILDDDAAATPLCVGGTTIATPMVVITGLGDAPGNEKIRFSGKLVFPAGTPAGTTPLDSIARGAQVRIEDLGSGATLLDVTHDTTPIPAGAAAAVCTPGLTDGWTVDAAAKRYLYLNQSGAMPPSCSAGSALGLRRLLLADQRAANGHIRVSGRGTGTIAPPVGDLRLTAVLGADAAAGLSGACGEVTIPALHCAAKLGGTKIVCK